MQDVQAKWADLHVGAYLRDQTGKVWKIIAERDFNYQVQDRDGEKKRLQPRDPRTPVTMVVPTEQEALEAAKSVLGAKVLARREAGETGWLASPFPTAGKSGGMTMARDHLSLLHGIWTGDVKTIAELIECHEDSHRDPLQGYQEHTHPGGNPA